MHDNQKLLNNLIVNKRRVPTPVLLLPLLLFWLMFAARPTLAHPSPNTLIFLDVSPKKAVMEIQLPTPELELAFGHDISKHPETIVAQYGPQLREYLLAHIHAFVQRDRPWMVAVTGLKMDMGTYAETSIRYWEVNATVTLSPQNSESTRDFYLDYDVIMHQVINHAALVTIRTDWENGHLEGSANGATAINWDLHNNIVPPLHVTLEKGSGWTGFTSMLKLGTRHIAEGTDHLMFLLTLLLPATLLVKDGKWEGFGGTRRSLARLLKITTAFTVGHSLTLLLGAANWVKVPTQPIEVLIAFSILVSAVHALRPIFPGREIFIAGGFGLIHGLAFAAVLSNLHLDTVPMLLSILGFNLGIEAMQLLIIAVTIPWLIMLSRNGMYTGVRVVGAVIAGVAAIGWMVERVSGKANFVSGMVQAGAGYAQWLVLFLAVAGVLSYFTPTRGRIKEPVDRLYP